MLTNEVRCTTTRSARPGSGSARVIIRNVTLSSNITTRRAQGCLPSVRLARKEEADQCVEFFARCLEAKEVFSPEFLCPMGVRSAVGRGQIMVCCDKVEIIAAVRFYRRKRSPCVSIYQFAVSPSWRGHGLFGMLLDALPAGLRIACCSPCSSLNKYYSKTGWILRRRSSICHEWALPTNEGSASGSKCVSAAFLEQTRGLT